MTATTFSTDIREVRVLKKALRPDTKTTRYAGFVEIASDRSWANVHLSPNPRTADIDKLLDLIHRDDLSAYETEEDVYTLMLDYPFPRYEGDDVGICELPDCLERWHSSDPVEPRQYIHKAFSESSAAGDWDVSVEATPGHKWAVCGRVDDDRTPEVAIDFAASIIRASDLASALNRKAH